MELKDYIRPLRKWWWLLVASTAVALVAAYLATRAQPPVYSTRATVMIGSAIDNPNPNGNELWLTQQLANTYADILARDNVRQGTMQALGLEWLPEYRARVVPNTQLVEINVTDTDPQRAQAVANELIQQLMKISPSGSGGPDAQRRSFIAAQLTDLEAAINETKDEITRRQAELGTLFSARQISDAQVQLSGLQSKLNSLQANYAALMGNTQRGALNSINVIEPPLLPTQPVGPNKRLTILLAGAIGFLLALGAVYLLEYLDDTLKNPDEVQKALGLTTLGAVPRIALVESGTELVILAGGQTVGAEAYRVLRTNLQFAAVERPLRTLMVTSPAPSEGKSTTIANLGAAMAQAGRRVILVDTDLHRPRLHRLLGLRNNVGITTALLMEKPSAEGLLQETVVPNLMALTSGPLPPNAAELLGSARMKALLEELEGISDIILMDSPPTVALADAAILSTLADGVLLVLDASKTRRDVAHRAVEALRRVNARVVGAVLNRMPQQSNGYYYYYYSYDHYTRGDDGQGTSPRSKNGRGRRTKPVRQEAAQGTLAVQPLPGSSPEAAGGGPSRT